MVTCQFKAERELGLLHRITVEDLGIGSFGELVTVRYHTPLTDVLDLLVEHKLSAVPIVDDAGMSPLTPAQSQNMTCHACAALC